MVGFIIWLLGLFRPVVFVDWDVYYRRVVFVDAYCFQQCVRRECVRRC